LFLYWLILLEIRTAAFCFISFLLSFIIVSDG
jgi:hypothetical protein